MIALRWQDFVASSSLSTDPVPLPGSRFGHGNADQVLDSGLVTQLHEEVYSRLSHGWLVLIGPPGSGKTGAMILLLLEALKHRKQVRRRDRAAVPVPVWLTLGSWDPTSKGLRDWVIETMGRDHEYLRAADFGPDAIGQMFDSRRIALFVDGLYEMPRDFVGRAVERLTTEGGGLRVTISSRPDQYRTTVEAGMQLPFPAVVKLDPVGVKDAADYLLNGSIGSRREAWQKVTDSLEDDPNGVLASTLNTPLTLSLARSAYSRTDPTELLRPALDTEQALRGHLLDQVLVTAYPDSSRRGYTADWLGWCAYQMSELPSGPKRDLQWWAIPNWLSRRQTRLVGALVLGLTFGVVGGVLVQFMDLSARFSFLPGIRLADSRAAWLVGGIGFGLLGAVVGRRRGDARAGANRIPSPRSLLLRWPTREHLPLLGWTLLVGVSVSSIVVLIIFVFALFGEVIKRNALFLLVVVAGLLAYGVLAPIVVWLLDDVWDVPTAASADVTPLSVYRRDLQKRLIIFVLRSITVGLLAGVICGQDSGLLAGLLGGLLIGPSVALALAFLDDSARFLLFTELALRLQGARVRFIPLLEEALDRQVLRQSGAVYQFRHADLQDRLSDRYKHEHPTGRTSTGLPNP